MKKSYIYPLLAATLLATGCSKETPFDGVGGEGDGQFMKSALSVNIDADGINVRTTRAAEADLDNFNILFYSDASAQPVKYRYGDMPEIVTLPAGKYTVTATYGENREADWENPYFLGKSEEFTVVPMEITSYIEPIVCHLENIMVSIDFDSVLRGRMSKDSYVEVKVGQSSALHFGLDEADAQKAGYFAHSDERTLVAVFHGTVDGSSIVETKSMQGIEKGNHYKITFKLHDSGNSDFTGTVTGGLGVEASVTVINVERNVPLIEDEVLDDGERPSEGNDPNEGDEGNDPQPDDPESPNPTITSTDVKLGQVNDGNTLSSCVLYIDSYHDDGILELTCDIDSPVLTRETLQEFQLDSHLDLVNTPAEMQSGMSDLNLPYNVGHQKHVVFDISRFLGILGSLSADYGSNIQHKFTITVKDGNGVCTQSLTLKF